MQAVEKEYKGGPVVHDTVVAGAPNRVRQYIVIERLEAMQADNNSVLAALLAEQLSILLVTDGTFTRHPIWQQFNTVTPDVRRRVLEQLQFMQEHVTSSTTDTRAVVGVQTRIAGVVNYILEHEAPLNSDFTI